MISEWIKASEMPASQLVQTYRASFEVKDNPLTKIYENEILRRLWVSEPSAMQTPPAMPRL